MRATWAARRHTWVPPPWKASVRHRVVQYPLIMGIMSTMSNLEHQSQYLRSNQHQFTAIPIDHWPSSSPTNHSMCASATASGHKKGKVNSGADAVGLCSRRAMYM